MTNDIVQRAKMLNLPSVQDYLDVLRFDCGSAPPPQFSSDVMLPLLELIEALEGEMAALKEAMYEAVNNEEDRIDYDCKCGDCTLTLKSIGDGLRAALGVKP